MKKLFTIAYCFSTLLFNAQVIPNVDWVKTYSERNQISNSPSAIDANGNVYLTGYTYPVPGNQDATTIKYDALGNLQWVKNYDNGGADNAKAIVLDASGNVIVTGESAGATSANDIFVIKYDGNTGAVLWTKRYNGAANGNESANAVTVDNNGTIFVTGYTTNTNGFRDYVTLKYDSNGNSGFISTYAGIANANNEAVSIAINNNRLYISGTANNINNTTTGNDYITSYYNGNNGATNWRKLYDNATNFDYATALTKDAIGNIVVTGVSSNTQKFEYHTLMYNASGVQQWVNKLPTNLVSPNTLPQITVDPLFNHFYVCGERLGTLSDILVYQITPSGNTTWSETYNGTQNGTDAAVDLVVNALGVIYVAGASLNSSAKFDYTTIRISQTPVVFPPDQGNEPFSTAIQYFKNDNLVLNTNGNVEPSVKFFTQNNSTFDFLQTNRISHVFAKIDTSIVDQDSLERIDLNFLNANPNTKLYEFDQHPDIVNFYFAHTGANGVSQNGSKRIMEPNIWTNIDLHYFTNNSGLKYYFVVKPSANPKSIRLNVANAAIQQNQNGSIQLKNKFGSVPYEKPIAYQINSMGSIVPVSFNPTYAINGNDISFSIGSYNPVLPLVIMMKQITPVQQPIQPIQNLNWSSYYGSSSAGDNTLFYDVKTNNSNSVWVNGVANGINFPIQNAYQGSNGGSRDVVFLKFNTNGVRQWATYLGGSLNEAAVNRINGIEVDNAGNLYSSFNTSSVNFPLNSSNLPGAYFDNVNAVNIANASPADIAIINLSNSGQLLWSTYFGGDDPANPISIDLGLDANGNLILTGIEEGIPIITPQGSYIPSVPIPLTNYCFIAKFNPNHQLVWSTPIGGGVGIIADRIAFNSQNDIFITGIIRQNRFLDYVNAGNGAYFDNTFNGGVFDGFVAKFGFANNDLKWCTLYGGNDNDKPHGITVDAADNIYIGGNTESTSGLINGNSFGFNNTNYSGTGTVFGEVAGDAFLVKFNSNLARISDTYYGGAAADEIWNIYAKGDELYTCFETSGNDVPFYGSNLALTYVQANNKNGQDIARSGYFMVTDRNFNQLWTSYLGGNGGFSDVGDVIYSNTVSNNKKYYTVGYASSPNNFPLTNPGASAYYQPSYGTSVFSQGFIAQFDLNALPIGIKNYKNDYNNPSVLVYPNPAKNQINLVNSVSDLFTVELLDVSGRLLKHFKSDSKTYTIQINDIPAGLYFVKTKSETQETVTKLIVDK